MWIISTSRSHNDMCIARQGTCSLAICALCLLQSWLPNLMLWLHLFG